MTKSPATPPVCDARTTPLPCPFCGGPASFFPEVGTLTRCGCKECDFALTAIEWNVRSAPPPAADEARTRLRAFADELRKWWSFDDGQQHTHSWHSREDFIAKKLPALLSRLPSAEAADGVWIKWPGGECPVPAETFVEAEFRNAQIDSDVARRFTWDHTDSRFDIIEFRITRAPGAGV